MFLSVDNVTIYLENLKDIKKTATRTNQWFSKFKEYAIFNNHLYCYLLAMDNDQLK